MWVSVAVIFSISLKLTLIDYFYGNGESNVNFDGLYWVDRT